MTSWTCPRRLGRRFTRAPSTSREINGELVILIDGRLSFDALQRRLVTAPTKARQLVAAVPESYVVFDLLALGGVDLRMQATSHHHLVSDSIVGHDVKVPGTELDR